jgi:thioredoxin-related protein
MFLKTFIITIIGCAIAYLTESASACDASDDIDYLKSVELAKSQRRFLLLAFIGTDWSMTSLKLDREVFDQPEFADNEKYNYLLCKLHFYQTQERPLDLIQQNQQLAERFGVEEFPTVVVLNPDGVEVGRLGYVRGGPEKFGMAVNAIMEKSKGTESGTQH